MFSVLKRKEENLPNYLQRRKCWDSLEQKKGGPHGAEGSCPSNISQCNNKEAFKRKGQILNIHTYE